MYFTVPAECPVEIKEVKMIFQFFFIVENSSFI